MLAEERAKAAAAEASKRVYPDEAAREAARVEWVQAKADALDVLEAERQAAVEEARQKEAKKTGGKGLNVLSGRDLFTFDPTYC